MAIQIKSIKTSGGDATTLAGAEALIANSTDTWILKYDEAMTDTTAAVINYVITTGSITVTVNAAYRHNGTFTHSGAKLSGSGNPQLRVDSDNVTVEWLDIRTSAAGITSAFWAQVNTTDNLVIRNCLIDRSNTVGSAAALHLLSQPTRVIVQDCLVRQGGGGAGGAAVRASRAYLINVTVIHTGSSIDYGISDETTGFTSVINCVVVGTFGTAAYRGTIAALGTGCNASSDTSAPGGTAYHSFNGSQFVNLAGGDPHWDNTATAALYPGADATAYTSGTPVDIDGDVRDPRVWDIGCDQARTPPLVRFARHDVDMGKSGKRRDYNVNMVQKATATFKATGTLAGISLDVQTSQRVLMGLPAVNVAEPGDFANVPGDLLTTLKNLSAAIERKTSNVLKTTNSGVYQAGSAAELVMAAATPGSWAETGITITHNVTANAGNLQINAVAGAGTYHPTNGATADPVKQFQTTLQGLGVGIDKLRVRPLLADGGQLLVSWEV